MQNEIKNAEKEIKGAKKNNKGLKKKICESVKAINENYHKGEVELKYKDLKGKKGSEIMGIYERKVGKPIKYANDIEKDKYEGKNSKKFQEAVEKFREEWKNIIISSKKIRKVIREDKVNTRMNENENVKDLSESLNPLKGINGKCTKGTDAFYLKEKERTKMQ